MIKHTIQLANNECGIACLKMFYDLYDVDVTYEDLFSKIDLRNNVKSGLKQVQEILNNIEEIKFIVMDSTDVCRHPLVQKIIDAYEIYEN